MFLASVVWACGGATPSPSDNTGGGNVGGGGGSAGASGGSAGRPSAIAGSPGVGGSPADLVMPIERSGKYVLEFENTVFEVDPTVGGRITTFSVAGQNVLAGADVTGNDVNWGSTVWPSPQTAWDSDAEEDWPPLEHVDSAQYTAAVEGKTIVLTGPAAPDEGDLAKVRVTKRFTPNLFERAIDCDLSLTNTDSDPKMFALWQVSRVAPNGLSFFPTGEVVARNELTTTDAAGVTWFQHPGGSGKINADAGGSWLAHVAGGLVFVKRFAGLTPAQQAPGEGEVELYAADEYVELEVQSEYLELAPGASLTWSVRWLLRPLPSTITPEVGSTELVQFVRGLAE